MLKWLHTAVIKYWAPTVAGLALAAADAYQMLHEIPDVSALSWHELAWRASKIAAIACLGAFSRFVNRSAVAENNGVVVSDSKTPPVGS